jgi:hypothetical protein
MIERPAWWLDALRRAKLRCGIESAGRQSRRGLQPRAVDFCGAERLAGPLGHHTQARRFARPREVVNAVNLACFPTLSEPDYFNEMRVVLAKWRQAGFLPALHA